MIVQVSVLVTGCSGYTMHRDTSNYYNTIECAGISIGNCGCSGYTMHRDTNNITHKIVQIPALVNGCFSHRGVCIC